LAGWADVRAWGGLGNGLAIALFLLNTVTSMRGFSGAGQPAAPGKGDIRFAHGRAAADGRPDGR